MTPWGRAITALRLCQIDPDGLGGIALHARSGRVRDAFLAQVPRNARRLHPAMPQDTLTGGIDVAGSLAEGTLVRHRGLLDAKNCCFLLTMAERTPSLMAGAIARLLDAGDGNIIIAMDEHAEDEAPSPQVLMERLAFYVSLSDQGLGDIAQTDAPPEPIPIEEVEVPDIVPETLVVLAVRLGITSLRAPSFALAAARAHAALNRRKLVGDADISAAAELVLAPRATQVPSQEETQDTPPDAQQNLDDAPQKAEPETRLPDELLLAAIQTALPPDLLAKTEPNAKTSASGSGAGQRRIGNRRGRPLPPRDTGARGSDARVDLVATLRSAIPWQRIRKSADTTGRIGPIIHPTDLRHKRFEDLSDRLLVFAVDASGSAALARLAEAKGAVELLLAEAYARRDHVALISFRGDMAEVLLPPTRSLVQTKRRLAELPGGGGTPLASGLKCGLETALTASRKGLSPVLIVLTDGRSNVALDGTPNRAQAASDTQSMARQIAQNRIDCIVIDTGRRPEAALRDLAASLRGHYASLPRANAQTLADTISTAIDI